MSRNNTISYDDLRTEDLSQTAASSGVKVGDFLQSLDLKRKQQLLQIPTDDADVRSLLIRLQLPEYVSDQESKAERRQRLVHFVQVNNDVDIAEILQTKDEEEEDQEMREAGEEEDDEEFYTPASLELIEARKEISKFAAVKAKERLANQYKISQLTMDQILPLRHSEAMKFKSLELSGSNLISSKPLSSVKINRNDTSQIQILTGTWNDGVYLLNSDLEPIQHFTAIEGKVSSVAWSPSPLHADQFIAASTTDVKLFSTLPSATTAPLSSLTGHEDRVTTVAYHPSSKYVASASFDRTWRLWDIVTSQELLLQESHSKECFALDFNSDGNLLVSAGLDALAYLWDLRGDRCVMRLEGHIRGIHAVRFRNNSYHIATGSSDGSVKIWDLRAQTTSCLETIPAHRGLISSLQFCGDNDSILISAGFDGSVKGYNADSWVKCGELVGHQGKVMASDFLVDEANGGKWWGVSCGWERDVKIWQ